MEHIVVITNDVNNKIQGVAECCKEIQFLGLKLIFYEMSIMYRYLTVEYQHKVPVHFYISRILPFTIHLYNIVIHLYKTSCTLHCRMIL